MITANDLKIQGIACLEESLADQPEAALYEVQQDVLKLFRMPILLICQPWLNISETPDKF